MDISKVIEHVISFLSNLFLILLLIWLAWWRRSQVSYFLDTIGVKSVGFSTEGVTLERFEERVSRAYVKQGLGPPSENDKRKIRNIRQYLAPIVAGRRILWVDDKPTGNKDERAAFVEMQIDVQSCRSTEEALRELGEKEGGFELVISDWNRPSSSSIPLPEGLRLLKEMREKEITIPVIFYHGGVEPDELTKRRKAASERGAIGTTGSPGELLQWTVAELVRNAVRDEQASFYGLST